MDKQNTENSLNVDKVNETTELSSQDISEVDSLRKEDDFFVYINRSITSIISSLIAVGLIVASKSLVEGLLGSESLNNLQNGAVVFFVVLCCFSLLVSHSLQAYFSKIIEKNVYQNIGASIFRNFVWQILLLSIFIVAILFAKNTQTESLYWVSGVYVMMSYILNISCRDEANSLRVQSGIFGVVLVSVFWLIFSYGLFQNQNYIWVYFFISLIVMQSFVSEICIAIAELVTKYFKD